MPCCKILGSVLLIGALGLGAVSYCKYSECGTCGGKAGVQSPGERPGSPATGVNEDGLVKSDCDSCCPQNAEKFVKKEAGSCCGESKGEVVKKEGGCCAQSKGELVKKEGGCCSEGAKAEAFWTSFVTKTSKVSTGCGEGGCCPGKTEGKSKTTAQK